MNKSKISQEYCKGRDRSTGKSKVVEEDVGCRQTEGVVDPLVLIVTAGGSDIVSMENEDDDILDDNIS